MSFPPYFSVTTERKTPKPGLIYIDRELYDNPKPIDFPLCDDTIILLFSLDSGFYVRSYSGLPSTKKFVYVPPNRKSVFISFWEGLGTMGGDPLFYNQVTYEQIFTSLF